MSWDCGKNIDVREPAKALHASNAAGTMPSGYQVLSSVFLLS